MCLVNFNTEVQRIAAPYSKLRSALRIMDGRFRREGRVKLTTRGGHLDVASKFTPLVSCYTHARDREMGTTTHVQPDAFGTWVLDAGDDPGRGHRDVGDR